MYKRLRSFYYAVSGIRLALREPNFRIQLGAAILVIAAGIWLKVSRGEWIALVICMFLVLAAELVNSAIEALTDAVYPGVHKTAARIKDLSAGAVLIIALGTVIVGAIIFIPRFLARV